MLLIAYFIDFLRGYYIAILMALAASLMFLINNPCINCDWRLNYSTGIGALLQLPEEIPVTARRISEMNEPGSSPNIIKVTKSIVWCTSQPDWLSWPCFTSSRALILPS